MRGKAAFGLTKPSVEEFYEMVALVYKTRIFKFELRIRESKIVANGP